MSEVGTKKSEGLSRRDVLRLMGAAGTGLAFAPFIPFGDFMPNPNQASLEKVPVILPDGSQANMNTYEINYDEVKISETGLKISTPENYFSKNKNPEIFLEDVTSLTPYVIFNDAELALCIFAAFKQLMP